MIRCPLQQCRSVQIAMSPSNRTALVRTVATIKGAPSLKWPKNRPHALQT